jgi:hypothetical protein
MPILALQHKQWRLELKWLLLSFLHQEINPEMDQREGEIRRRLWAGDVRRDQLNIIAFKHFFPSKFQWFQNISLSLIHENKQIRISA